MLVDYRTLRTISLISITLMDLHYEPEHALIKIQHAVGTGNRQISTPASTACNSRMSKNVRPFEYPSRSSSAPPQQRASSL